MKDAMKEAMKDVICGLGLFATMALVWILPAALLAVLFALGEHFIIFRSLAAVVFDATYDSNLIWVVLLACTVIIAIGYIHIVSRLRGQGQTP